MPQALQARARQRIERRHRLLSLFRDLPIGGIETRVVFMPRVHDFESGSVEYPMLGIGRVAIPKRNAGHDNACAPGRACREWPPILEIAFFGLVEIRDVECAGQESAGPVKA